MTRTLAFLFAFAILLTAAICGAQTPSPDTSTRLIVAQDEDSQEKVIEANLRDVHKLIVNETTEGQPNDLYLELPFDGGPMPKFKVLIDTQVLNTDKDTNNTIERGVLINLMTDVKVPADKRAAVLEKINEVNRRKAFSSIYIDSDGEIVCCWILNILSDGLPVEYVHDAVVRVQSIWKELYTQAAPTLGLPRQSSDKAQ